MPKYTERQEAVMNLQLLLDSFQATINQPKERLPEADEVILYHFTEGQLQTFSRSVGQALSYLLLNTSEESTGDSTSAFGALLGTDDPELDKK